MQDRTKIEERKSFTKDDKIFILDKSDGRCAHCGKRLTINDEDFTVEHIIPISKGGTNTPSNIIALCKICNFKKDNDIIFPTEYFKHLKKEFEEEIFNNQIEYYKTFNWFTLNNFIVDDRMELTSSIVVDSFASKRRQCKTKGFIMQRKVEVKCVLSKAGYSDLDAIFNHAWKYNTKYNIYNPKECLRSLIEKIFLKGAFYIIRNSSNEIVAVLPVAISGMYAGDKHVCILRVFNPMCMYNKPQYRDVVGQAIHWIAGCLNEVNLELDESIDYRSILLECNINDSISREIFYEMNADKCLMDSEGGDPSFRAGIVAVAMHNEKDNETDSSKEIKAEDGVGDEKGRYKKPIQEVIEDISEALLKKLNMSIEDIILGDIQNKESKEN